jgi:hypothetical protein
MRLRIPIAVGVGAVALAPASPAHAVVDQVDPLATGAERHAKRIVKEKRKKRREKRARAAAVAVPGHLQAIAACESGGDPNAVDATGTYRGKYQFDMGTWASVGGSGDPAAAPEAEQDRRAAMLYARAGATPWPVCGS